jgi:hypothetical protein
LNQESDFSNDKPHSGEQNQELQPDLRGDFRIPFRPNFRSILPQKPEPFRSLNLGVVEELDAGRDDDLPDRLKLNLSRFAPALPRPRFDP